MAIGSGENRTRCWTGGQKDVVGEETGSSSENIAPRLTADFRSERGARQVVVVVVVVVGCQSKA